MKLGGGLKSIPNSSMTRKPDSVPDQFPAGLRVLVVDDDPTCLIILEKMLRTCSYHVTKTNRAEHALDLLRENKNGFDVVISDVHMPDMDGFKLLEHVGLEMDLPVIMMSADDSNTVVMKGVTHGACDYLIKPVRIEALKNIWQHVIRKKKHELKDMEQSSSWEEEDLNQKQDDTVSSPANEGSWKGSKRKGDDEDSDEKDDTTTLKKPRVVWSVELHQQFVAAVNQLGVEKAVPKKILELMNVPGLTRENVASHLQKYRLYLRRLSGVSQHQGGLTGSFMSHDSCFGAMSSLGGMDIQALLASGQLSAQTLAGYTRLPPTIRPSMPMPFADQRNLFSFENSKPRYGDTAHQQQAGLVRKQMNLLHGIPTTMEPKQLAGLNQSANMGNIDLQTNVSVTHQSSSSLMQMTPQQSRGTLGSTAGLTSLPSSGPVLFRNGMGCNPVSKSGPIVDYTSLHQISDLPCNTFPLESTPGLTSMTSKGFNQVENNSDSKSIRGYVGSYDVFLEIQPQKSRDWQPPNSNMNFVSSSRHSTSVQNSVNVSPSVLVNQSYVTSQKNDLNRNALAGKVMCSNGLDVQNPGVQNNNRNNVNGVFLDNSPRVKAEISDILSPGTNFCSEHYGQEDLISAYLKQQDGFGTVEYNFDGCTLDNIPVND